MELNTTEIKALEAKGFNRWQKGNMDRLYINAANIGLVCQYYKTGNVRDAWFDGESISNCEARRMKAAKTFIDVKSGMVYSDSNTLKDKAEQMLEDARRNA